MRRFAIVVVPLLCSLSALNAYALPGEADAVLRHCGAPQSESIGTSPVTGLTQRDFIYSDTILHFVPDGAGWTFTTGWQGHFPVTRGTLETTMPCFRQALEEVAARPAAALDPTIAHQTVSAIPTSANAWGFPHLGLIALLAIAFLIALLWPRRKRPVPEQIVAQRTRKPGVPEFIYRPPTRVS